VKGSFSRPLAAMAPMGGFALVAMFTFAYRILGGSNVQKRPAEVCWGIGCPVRCLGGVSLVSDALSRREREGAYTACVLHAMSPGARAPAFKDVAQQRCSAVGKEKVNVNRKCE
jgi:hypothetical protein